MLEKHPSLRAFELMADRDTGLLHRLSRQDRLEVGGGGTPHGPAHPWGPCHSDRTRATRMCCGVWEWGRGVGGWGGGAYCGAYCDAWCI